VAVVALGFGGDSFAIGNLGRLGMDGDFVPVFHFGQHNPQVQVAQAADDQFFGLRIASDFEADIFFAEFFQGTAEAVFIAA